MSAQMYGFVLLPDRKVSQQIIEVNTKFFPLSPLQLNKDYTLPHCTVLQAPIRPTFDYQTFLNQFSQFPGFKHEPRTKLGHLYQNGNAVLIDVENARWLSDFNSHMVNEVAKFIDVPPTPQDMVFENASQQESYRLTGYKRNLEAYSPHFTVAHNAAEEVFAQNDFVGENNTVRFRSLAFCKHGEYGKIEEVISQISLPFQWD